MCKYSDDDVVHFSNQMCRFFDIKKGICSCYDKRLETEGADCRKVSMDLLEHHMELLPPSCAYRRLYEGRGLPKYHPLLSGKKIPKKYTVASLPVFSEKNKEDAKARVVMEGLAKGQSDEAIYKRLAEVEQKYELKWLETYPLVKKATV